MTADEPRRRRRHRLGPDEAAPRKASLPRPRLAVGLAIAGFALAGLIAVNALSATGAFGPSPDDRVREAWGLFAQPEAKRDKARIEALARSALDDHPLQSRAASLLAVIEEQRGDRAKAGKLMLAASRLSRRDDVADFWLFNTELDARRYDQAMLHADALLRRRFLVISPQVYPRILTNFNDPDLATAVAKRLALNPPWRPNFLQAANVGFKDSSAPFAIYSALQKAGGQPTAQELAPYLARLLADKKYEEAYLSWVLFLPQSTLSRLENIYDGDFEGWPETPPFGWDLSLGVRGSIESAEAYNRDGSALRIDYDGLGSPKLPKQVLILPPGTYRFTGKVLTANEDSTGRMQWTIACDGGASLIPEAPVPDTRTTWKSFSAFFTVPEGCKGQWLELKSIPGERRVNVEVWFDNLAIERAEVAAGAPS